MAATSLARDQIEQSIQDYEQLFGKQHVLTLHLRFQLAGINALQNRNEDAEQEFSRVLRDFEETRGGDDQLTLETMYHFGAFYLENKKLQQAKTLFRSCFEGRRRTIGAGHPATLHAASKLEEVGAYRPEND